MKTHAMVSVTRSPLTRTELQALLHLARCGADQVANGHHYLLSRRQEAVATDVIEDLERGLASLQGKQAEAKARRETPKREAERRAAREYHAQIDGYTVWGMLGLSGPMLPMIPTIASGRICIIPIPSRASRAKSGAMSGGSSSARAARHQMSLSFFPAIARTLPIAGRSRTSRAGSSRNIDADNHAPAKDA